MKSRTTILSTAAIAAVLPFCKGASIRGGEQTSRELFSQQQNRLNGRGSGGGILQNNLPWDFPKTKQCSPETSGTAEATNVEAMLQASYKEQNLTNAVYRIERGDTVIAAGGIGDSTYNVNADQNMHFKTGNVSYKMLGALLLLLVEDGIVALDDTLNMFLPELGLINDDIVTLEMLVRSTTGYRDFVTDSEEFTSQVRTNPYQHFDWEKLVQLGVNSGAPWCPPGTCWSYSHVNFLLLGKALEVATGVSLDVLLEERIIEPLGLTNTKTQVNKTDIPSPALHTYSKERGIWEDTTFWDLSWADAPNGTVISTICDLTDYAKGLGLGSLFRDPSSYDTYTTGVYLPAPADCPFPRCRDFRDETWTYAMGFSMSNGWLVASPNFGGAAQVAAYLPEQDLRIAIIAVAGMDSENYVQYARNMFTQIAAELSPNNIPSF